MSSEAIPSHDEVLTFSNSMLSIKSQIDELNSKLSNLSNNLDSDNIEVKYGLSYYESKQNLFIIYLTELVSYMLSKVNAVHSIDDSPVVQNLIKIKALIEKEKNLQQAILSVKKKYGKNAIMRGVNLLDCSTYRERNNQIGGHRA